ncbi:MAG: acyltransferase [Pseudodesulfovibrio sp.]
MFNWLAFLTNGIYWKVHSFWVRLVLRAYGIRCGSNFHIRGIPLLKVRGEAANIVIGDNVQILGDIDLRNRENGKIVIHDNVTIEGGCRFVAAREATISVDEYSAVTTGALINAGADITIGKNCIIGTYASINSSEHAFERNTIIREQGYVHEAVELKDDCWLGTKVCITKGVVLGEGTIVGAGSIVTKSTDEYGIYVGAPAKKIGERPE